MKSGNLPPVFTPKVVNHPMIYPALVVNQSGFDWFGERAGARPTWLCLP